MNINSILRIFSLFILLSVTSNIICQSAESDHGPKAKNIILMIGDGMGLSQVQAGMTHSPNGLNLEQLKVIGLQKTESADSYITDSAASATAIASGEKANNGVIGMNSAGENTESIIEFLKAKNFKTGLIATNTISHATPAAFVAHQPNRDMYEEIALDISKSGVDVLIGGGLKHFGDREDGKNLVSEMKSKGYKFTDNVSNINSSWSKILALTANSHMPFVVDGRGDFLSVSVEKALESLNNNNENGFFLMVEASQIDPACHNNNQEQFIAEMLDFDKAIGKALDFVKKNGETLLVVTGDHETGGVTVLKGNYETGKVEVNFSTKGHTGVMLPVYSCGPQSEGFSGIFNNTDFKQKFIKALNISN